MAKTIKRDELSLRGVKRGTEEKGFDVDSPVILVIGDLHLSSKYRGSHIDYEENCMDIMVRTLSILRDEDRPVTLFLLGDVFGVKERNITPQPRFFSKVLEFFKELNTITRGRVFSVRGNHDYGEFPDFNIFEQLGLIKNPDHVDFRPNGSFEGRFHFVNYGNEYRDLDMAGDGVSNIILGHNDFAIEGVTNWYGSDSNIDLRKMLNFRGADLLISGHIHDPSEEVYSCNIGTDHEIDLFYPGCPSRVSQRYDECYYVQFEFNGDGTDYNMHKYGLKPAEEIFHPAESEVTKEESEEEHLRSARLEDILLEISEKSIFSGGLTQQIKNVPYASDEAKKIAIEYLELAY